MNARVFAALLAAFAWVAPAAQTTGTAGAAAGYLQPGGPDVSHQREGSTGGLSFWGSLSRFGKETSLQLEWRGALSPDFHLRAAGFRPAWVLEASADQRSYLADGAARFAWDPATGALDPRAAPALAVYLPDPTGSPAGRFDPATLGRLRDGLPEGAPGWRQQEFSLTLRTLTTPWGVSAGLEATVKEGTLPRTFVVATGFTPVYIPFFLDGPVGEPLGVLEVPERFRERDLGLRLAAFQKAGAWRWEESLGFSVFRLTRLVDAWANPFPGPALREPRAFFGTSGRLNLSARGPGLWASVEHEYRDGRGEAGWRVTQTTRLRLGADRAVGGGTTLFAEAGWRGRSDRVALADQGPHPVFQGAFYDLIYGPLAAPAPRRAYPWRERALSVGARAKHWEVALGGRDGTYENRYGRRRQSLEGRLRWSPLQGLDLLAEPAWVRVTELVPEADAFVTELDTEAQSAAFRPADARSGRLLGLTARLRRGPGVLSYTHREQEWGPAAGLRSRRSEELFGALQARRGPYRLTASARLSDASLDLAATTYAAAADPADPADPLHRLPLAEHWSRTDEAASLLLERDVAGPATVGAECRWLRQRSAAGRVLDDSRDYRYLKAGLYVGREFGALTFRVEGGVEKYASRDPLFRPASAPGPYLWAGLTERPGTRGYLTGHLAWRF